MINYGGGVRIEHLTTSEFEPILWVGLWQWRVLSLVTYQAAVLARYDHLLPGHVSYKAQHSSNVP